MKTYKLVQDNLNNFRGHAAVYEVSPPMKNQVFNADKNDLVWTQSKYVVVSTISDHFADGTAVFLSNKKGQVKHWGELVGSFRGHETSPHEVAFDIAGYEKTN